MSSTNPAGFGVPPAGTRPERVPVVAPDLEMLLEIGRGTYGEVWLARSLTGAYRAVKIVRHSSMDEDKALQREFEGLIRYEPISRKNESQVGILHVGRSGDDLYYVMELADDQQAGREVDPATYSPRTLKSDLKTRPRPSASECVGIGFALTAALQCLHENGLVHRDIKPSNIIFVDGVPKLADIGLVADLDSTRSFVGTEGFLAPEGPGSARADIFSLGKVLYEMATGKDRREFPALPEDLRTRPDRNGFLELNEVVLKACQADPRLRYQSAAEMHADLAVIAAGKSIRRSHRVERRLKAALRVGLLATGVATIATVAYIRARRAEATANDRLVRLSTSHAVELCGGGDVLSSLVWTAESLRLVAGDSPAEEIQRLRFASALRAAPKLKQMFWHADRILASAFSPDGKRVATASADRTARVWDAGTGDPITPPLWHEGEVRDVSFSPDGAEVVTASEDQTVRVWTINATGKPRLVFSQPDIVTQAVFSPDGRWVAGVSGRDNLYAKARPKQVQLWDSGTGAETGPPIRHPQSEISFDNIRRIAFSPDSTRLVTAGSDGTARVWNVPSGTETLPPLIHKGSVRAASFNPAGTRILTAGLDGMARLWDARTGLPSGMPLAHPAGVLSAEFSRDGRWIVTGCRDHVARVWDVHEGRIICATPALLNEVRQASFHPDGTSFLVLDGESKVRVWSATNGVAILPPMPQSLHLTVSRYSPDGLGLLTAGLDGEARLWDLRPSSNDGVTVEPDGMVHRASFSPDGRWLATCRLDGRTMIWHAQTGEPRIPQLSATAAQVPPFNDIFLAWGTDGSEIVTTSAGGALHRWNFKTGREIDTPFLRGTGTYLACYSPDGESLVTVTYDKGYIGKWDPALPAGFMRSFVRVWNLKTGVLRFPEKVTPQQVGALVFSPDGRHLCAGWGNGLVTTEGGFQVWSATSGNPESPVVPMKGIVGSAMFSPDSRLLLVADSDYTPEAREARLWDLRRGRFLPPRFRHHDGVSTARFGRNAESVVTAGEDGDARLWNSKTGEILGLSLEHTAGVYWADFSHNGRMVITASADSQARVWDSKTGEPILLPFRHRVPVTHAEFGPDGRHALTVGQRESAHLWRFSGIDWPVRDLQELAELLSARGLERAGGLQPLDREAIVARWKAVHEKHPEAFPRDQGSGPTRKTVENR